jgi:hypothetical protein
MQTYTIILMVVACVVLGLSIWAFVTRCTDKFGDAPGQWGACCPKNMTMEQCKYPDNSPFHSAEGEKDIRCPPDKTYHTCGSNPWSGPWPYACQ